MKRWAIIFRALANINRLKIIKFLSKEGLRTVTEISDELQISIKATSQHLIILHNLGLLENVGKQGHVFYTLSPKPPQDLENAIKLFL